VWLARRIHCSYRLIEANDSTDEVIEIDQDPLGKQASLAVRQGSLEVWVKDLADGSKAVCLFNRRMFDTTISVSWDQIGLNGPQHIRDVWRQQDIGTSGRGYSTVGVRLTSYTVDDIVRLFASWHSTHGRRMAKCEHRVFLDCETTRTRRK
jgi:hypothetical protein